MGAYRWPMLKPWEFPLDTNTEEELQEVFLPPEEINPINEAPQNPAEPQSQGSSEGLIKLPEVLPILPLRGLVVYPQTMVPLTIGQPRSIRLVDDVVAGERLFGLVASKVFEIETPGPEHLFRVGTAAVIHRMFRAPDGTIRLLVQGLVRFRIIEFTATEPYLMARVEVLPEILETGLQVEALERNVREQFIHMAELIPSMPRELVATIAAIPDPLQLVYNIANIQRMDINDAQEILELNRISEKLQKLVTILAREIEVLELSQKIQKEARSEIDKVQREYFLREQLKAIQRELGEGDEQAAEIEEFRKRIEAAKNARRG